MSRPVDHESVVPAAGDLHARWGEQNVKRASPRALRALALPADAAAVLTSRGLPVQDDYLFRAQVAGEELAVTEVAAGGRSERWLKFGTDFAADLCVDGATGTVMALAPDAGLRDRFVNSSLRTFLTFLLHVSRERALFPQLADAEIDRRVAALRRRLAAIDAPAFAGPGTWWAEVFQQLEHGLL